ncbi:hypothetical protein MB02_06095 [Croceicoccus estronivorus]|nr:hypothetical protein MB02_06095 [Croceicoccus estronivorus]
MKSVLSFAAPLAAALLLAGCGKSDEGPKTPEQAVAEAAKMEKPEPGKYRSSVKVLEFDVPGLPPEQAKQMKAMMSAQQTQTHEFCLTADDVEKGYKEMIKKSSEGNCSFDRFDASSNTLDAQMTCDMGQGTKASMTMNGTTSATGSNMVMDINHSAPQIPGGEMHTKMEVTNERIGECS